MECLNMLLVFFVIGFATFSSSYTITKDVIPSLPSEKLIDETLIRHLPDGETVNITCTRDTVLNKKTLTCDFEVSLKKKVLIIEPAEDCRNYKNCDSVRCIEMPCPGDTLFNIKTGRCDYSYQANCCEFIEKNSSRILADSSFMYPKKNF